MSAWPSLEIDPVRHRATRGGQRFDVSAKEFTLMSLLALKTGQVLSRTQIASMLWAIHFNSDTNVVEFPSGLRAKIDDPFPGKLIHAVRGAGPRAGAPNSRGKFLLQHASLY